MQFKQITSVRCQNVKNRIIDCYKCKNDKRNTIKKRLKEIFVRSLM